MQRTWDAWMIRVLMLVLVLGAIPLAAEGAQPLQASGTSGTAYAWGYNFYGQLGNGSMTDSSTPILVSLPSGTTPLPLGPGSSAFHSLAILSSSNPTAALVMHFHVAHQGHGVVVHWRVASNAGIAGFSLTAGTRHLNRTLIPVHAGNLRYRYASRVGGFGSYVLHGVLRGGGSVAFAGS